MSNALSSQWAYTLLGELFVALVFLIIGAAASLDSYDFSKLGLFFGSPFFVTILMINTVIVSAVTMFFIYKNGWSLILRKYRACNKRDVIEGCILKIEEEIKKIKKSLKDCENEQVQSTYKDTLSRLKHEKTAYEIQLNKQKELVVSLDLMIRERLKKS